jgi:RHS repeat-associated protein
MTDWKNGILYETRSYGRDGVTLLRRTLSESTNKVVPWVTDQTTAPPYDTRTTKEVVITVENGSALAVLNTKEYDENGSSDPAYFAHLNPKRSKSYKYKALGLTTAQTADIQSITSLYSPGDLLSTLENDFLYEEGYKSRYIFGLPSESRVLSPSGDVLSKAQIQYDQQGQYYSLLDYGSTTGYSPPTGAYAHLRGNATTARTWIKDSNTWLETHSQFDNFGNIRKIWDSTGDPNRFVEAEYASESYYGYATKTITPAPDPTGTRGTAESSTVFRSFDFWTGLQASSTDSNGQTTYIEYDSRLRPKKITPPAGGKITEINYGDTPGNFYVTTKTQVEGQNWKEATTFLDNFGRPVKGKMKDRQGDVFAEIEYDNLGRIKRTSNPYRQGEQKLWSVPIYDNANRTVGSSAPAPEGQTGPSLGTVEQGISTIPGLEGNYVTTTDAAGRKRRAITNVFGEVIRVDEPTGNNDLGSLESPNQPSFYTYNVKGELIKILQGQQSRFFMYDSRGRLIRTRQSEQAVNPSLATAGNPENNQWTAGYTYDGLGNMTSVTDAKNTVISMTYDKAGRVITKSYSDAATPQVNYYYDGTGLGLSQLPGTSKGRISKITNGISETANTSFDSFGRILTNRQVTDGKTYNFEYKYDDYGNLVEEKYPSGRTVKIDIDSDGALSTVSSRAANTPYKTYASNFDYSADGSFKAMQLGNGRWETASYNHLSQLTQIGLGNSTTDTSLLKINYDYGELNTDGSVDASKNTGLIAKQTIAVPSATFVQTYKYDALIRLTEAKETATTATGSENWKQTFDYDRYGNRTGRFQKIGSITLPIDNKTLPQVDPTTNRFSTGQGYTYDFNGNLIQDAENRGFTYDGEDKQTVVRDLNIQVSPLNPDANVIGKYYYDGEGHRVKKVTNTETTIFVYGAGGNLVAEYSTQINPQPTTSYITTDSLGSPRVLTNKKGDVISRRDFMPFGEEIYAGVGARTANMKYSTSGIDNVRQRFTGYEKDPETDLDFAQNRMYKNGHGRFSSADPLLSAASLENPQTFNRFAYTGNNPVNFTDPDGLDYYVNQANGDVEWFAGSEERAGYTRKPPGSTTTFDRGGCVNNQCFNAGDSVIYGSNSITLIPPKKGAQAVDANNYTVNVTGDPDTSLQAEGGSVPVIAPTFGDHALSAAMTFGENNGGNAVTYLAGQQPYDQHTEAGQFTGNVLSVIQSATEIVTGGTIAVSGGAATIFTAPACLSLVGCAIPAATGTVSITGVAIVTHGVAVLGNTLYNVAYNQGPSSRSGSSGSGSQSGGGSGGKNFSRDPHTIQDQMTMDAAKNGAGQKIIDNLGDPQFKGWEKWEYKVKSNEGYDSVVHYVRDPATGKTADFKFTKHSSGVIP